MHWTELINLSKNGVCEPPFKEGFSEKGLWESLINGMKLDLLDLFSHSQGVKRAVKFTTEASKSVCGINARHINCKSILS